MAIDKLAEFKLRLDEMKDPRIRKSFIASFHAYLVQGGIYGLTPNEIDLAAKIEKRFGFVPHSQKLLNHPAYQENSRSILHLKKLNLVLI